jgi:hypothetical protein
MQAYVVHLKSQGKPYFARRVLAKIKLLATGREHTDATKVKMSLSQQRRHAEGRGGFVCTEELAERRSRSAKRQWKLKRAEMLAAMQATFESAAYKANRSEAALKQWARDGRMLRERLKAAHNTPAAIANHSAENRRRWSVGVYDRAA